MKKAHVLISSKEILQDMEFIAKHEKIKLSEWIGHINYNFNVYIQIEKNKIIKEIEGKWMLDKITSEEFKRITGKYPSKTLRREKELWKKYREQYKDNARDALLMNIK